MFYYLTEFHDVFPVLNVFQYITFRTGGALITAALCVFWFGPSIIRNLRGRQGKGQPIRADGPASHFKKAGTPTMGGLMILFGIAVSTLLWANLTSIYVWVVLGVTMSFGAIGFYDDYFESFKIQPQRIFRQGAIGHRIPCCRNCRLRADEQWQGTLFNFPGLSVFQEPAG